jgi:hypothetical protein
MTRTLPLSLGLFPLPRDVGGYPTKDGRRVAWGQLLFRESDGSLHRTEAQRLMRHGISTALELIFSDDGASFPPTTLHLPVTCHAQITSAYPDYDAISQPKGQLIIDEQRSLRSIILAIADAPKGAILISGQHAEYLEWLGMMILGLVGVVDHALIEHAATRDLAMLRIQAGWETCSNVGALTERVDLEIRALRDQYHTFEAYAHVIGLSRLDLIRLKNRLLET